jgi:hypothetical protein
MELHHQSAFIPPRREYGQIYFFNSTCKYTNKKCTVHKKVSHYSEQAVGWKNRFVAVYDWILLYECWEKPSWREYDKINLRILSGPKMAQVWGVLRIVLSRVTWFVLKKIHKVIKWRIMRYRSCKAHERGDWFLYHFGCNTWRNETTKFCVLTWTSGHCWEECNNMSVSVRHTELVEQLMENFALCPCYLVAPKSPIHGECWVRNHNMVE